MSVQVPTAEEHHATAVAVAGLDLAVDMLDSRVAALEAAPPPPPGQAPVGPVVELASLGVSPANSAQVNGRAIRAAAAAHGGRHLRFPVGVVEVDAVRGSAEANPLVGGEFATAWFTSGTWVEIPTGCTLRFMGPSATKGQTAPVAAGIHRLFSNRHMDGSGGGDRGIRIFGGGTIDANAGNLTYSGTTDTARIVDCIDLWHTFDCTVEGLTVIGCHGENGSSGENFAVELMRSRNARLIDLRVARVSGQCATGIHVCYCVNTVVDRCSVDGMDVQGFSVFGSRSTTLSQCSATRNKRGFNFEYCWDSTAVACVAGGVGARYPKHTQGTAQTPGLPDGDTTILGNREAGFHILNGGGTSGCGGGRYTFVGCEASGQTTTNARGIGITAAHSFTASSGTTDRTIVAPSTNHISKALVGSLVQCGPGRRLVRITAVSGTTVTTDAPHGGGSGSTVLVHPGRIVFRDCSIVENQRGIQFLSPASTSASRAVDVTGCTFEGNVTDVQDAARSDTQATTIARLTRGANLSNHLTLPINGTPTFNPLPFDVAVWLAGSSRVAIGERTADPNALTVVPVPGGGPLLWPAGTWLAVNATQAVPTVA